MTMLPASPKPRLLDQVRSALRVRGYSYRTEQSYVDIIRRFILFHQKQHPRDLGPQAISPYLAYLAEERNVAPSTLCASASPHETLHVLNTSI